MKGNPDAKRIAGRAPMYHVIQTNIPSETMMPSDLEFFAQATCKPERGPKCWRIKIHHEDARGYLRAVSALAERQMLLGQKRT